MYFIKINITLKIMLIKKIKLQVVKMEKKNLLFAMITAFFDPIGFFGKNRKR